MKTDAAGKAFIKSNETCRLHVYPDQGGWSIGYGHHLSKKDWFLVLITQAKADELFEADIAKVDEMLAIEVPGLKTQGQYNACADMAYNVGNQRFITSTLRRLISAKMFKAAANQFPRWVHGENGKVVPALVIRCVKRKEMFLS